MFFFVYFVVLGSKTAVTDEYNRVGATTHRWNISGIRVEWGGLRLADPANVFATQNIEFEEIESSEYSWDGTGWLQIMKRLGLRANIRPTLGQKHAFHRLWVGPGIIMAARGGGHRKIVQISNSA